MITSYVNPPRSMLYLSLVGALDSTGADDLVQEYYERHTPALQRCLLDLSGAESADGAGLNVLHRLSLLAQVDRIEFSVVAKGSQAAEEVREAAHRFWVDIVDGAELPLAG